MNWQQTVLPNKFLLKRYEKSYLFRTPSGLAALFKDKEFSEAKGNIL